MNLRTTSTPQMLSSYKTLQANFEEHSFRFLTTRSFSKTPACIKSWLVLVLIKSRDDYPPGRFRIVQESSGGIRSIARRRGNRCASTVECMGVAHRYVFLGCGF